MQRHPVIGVLVLVVVVVREVVVLPDVFLRVDMVLIHIVVHLDVGEAILDLLTVVVGNGGEGVEQIGVHLLSLQQLVPGLLLSLLCLLLGVWLISKVVGREEGGVEEQVDRVADSSKGTEWIS